MRLKNLSLKTKMALAVSLLFMVFTTTLLYLAFAYYGKIYKKNVFQQQYVLVSALADSLDDKLEIIQGALVAVAQKAPAGDLTDPEKGQRYLDDRITLSSLFDNGLFLISREGTVIAESPYRPDGRGRDMSSSEFFKRTMAAGRSQISAPYVSTRPGQPAVVLTVPIFDAQGKMRAILAGSLNLLGKNILHDLTPFKFGKTGYIYLSDSKRNLILHPDPKRVMEPGPVPGINPMFDRAVAGFDGSDETVNSTGVPMLLSSKHLRNTDWIILANYPLAEAYAPLKKMQLFFVAGIALSLALLLLLAWRLMKCMTKSLSTLAHHVESLPEKARENKLINCDSGDEIGTLSRAFNGMVLELDRREDSLRESEERYKAIFQNNHAVMVLLNPITGEIVDANPAAGAFYGYTREELTGKKLSDITIMEANELSRALGDALYARKERFFFKHVLADGAVRDVEVYSGPLVIGGKKLLLSIIHDVTASKEAEEAFRASHTLLEKTLASLIDAVFIVAADTTRIEGCNPAASKMFGYEQSDLIGQSPTLLHLSEERATWFRTQMLKSHQASGYFETLFQMKRADGSIFHSEHYVTPIYDPDGAVKCLVCVVKDITERKRVEDEYRRLNELLEQRVQERTAELVASNRELESFCYSVSHDLRSPLRGIDGFCSILKEEYADRLDDDGREYLNRIGSAAVRMGQLIDDLLNLSRVTRSELIYNMVDLSQMARLVMDEFRQLDSDRQVEFTTVNGAVAKADRRLIRVVMENLLGNAWKFSKNRPLTKIEFGIGQNDTEAYYFIADNGVGFDMNYAHKLFKPFQRLHGVTEFAGTGIGLASVQRIISRHGGRVWVESEVDKGTTFYFTLVE